MKRRIVILTVVAMALAVLAGCSAFDHDNTPYEGFDRSLWPTNPSIMVGPYEGNYEGTMKLDSKDAACASVAEEVGAEAPISFDVVQAGPLVSVGFEDGAEENGKLIETKVTIVQRGASDVRMFYIEFSDAGLSGTVEVMPAADSGSVDACASYTLTMTRISE